MTYQKHDDDNPEVIYIQQDEATWCRDRINDDDVMYVRADKLGVTDEPTGEAYRDRDTCGRCGETYDSAPCCAQHRMIADARRKAGH